MQYDFNLLCYVFLKVSKIVIIFKILLHIRNDYFLELSFGNFLKIPYRIMTWNWKLGKLLTLVSFKYSYFKPIFKYIVWWTLMGAICHRFCDTLMCFHLRTQNMRVKAWLWYPLWNKKDSFLGLSHSPFSSLFLWPILNFLFCFMSNEIILLQILYKNLEYLFSSFMKVKIVKFIQCGPNSINSTTKVGCNLLA